MLENIIQFIVVISCIEIELIGRLEINQEAAISVDELSIFEPQG